MCGQQATIEMPKAAFDAFDHGRGEHIQVAWPLASADQRELVLTGTHPKCWDAMFGE
jgi:hypothetical protein